jgi:hypothetical protein
MNVENENISILNYDTNKKRLVLSSVKIGDTMTKKREIKWDFEPIINEFEIYYMKFVNDLLQKAQIKKNKNTDIIAELIKIVYSIVPKPNENKFKCNIEFDTPKSLTIDYYCLSSIGNIIMFMLQCLFEKNIKEFPLLLHMLIDQKDFSNVYDIELWGKSLIQFKDEFKKMEELTFDLSTSNSSDIFCFYYMILFYHFYNTLFPNVKQITINLNVNRINNIYNVDRNPYKITDDEVIAFFKNHEYIFLSNYILTCIIGSSNITSLKIIMYESYINENNFLFAKQFERSSFKEMIPKKLSLLYFRQLMMIEGLPDISMTINSLDTFLFREIINLTAIYYKEVKKIQLELFTKPKYINLRKLYLNYLKGQEFQEMDPNIIEKYQIIMYPYIESIEEFMQPLIEEEKIPDLLFPEFKKNINTLKMILSELVTKINSFYLDASPYDELCKYDNYNIEILLFIFAILSALERPNRLTSLQLKCSTISYTTVLQIKKKINSIINNTSIDLSKCNELQILNLNMSGISLFIDFNKLPCNNLTKLSLYVSTLNDMKAINEGLKNLKNNLLKLNDMKITICINISTEIFDECLKIYDNLPLNLEIFILTIENIIGQNDLVKIIKNCHRNIKFISGKNILYCLVCDSQELEMYLDNFRVHNLKSIFASNGCDFVKKCKLKVGEMKKITLTLTKWPERNILESIIFAFNKKIEENNEKLKDNKTIFSRIFGFMAKTQDFLVALN